MRGSRQSLYFWHSVCNGDYLSQIQPFVISLQEVILTYLVVFQILKFKPSDLYLQSVRI